MNQIKTTKYFTSRRWKWTDFYSISLEEDCQKIFGELNYENGDELTAMINKKIEDLT
jgi:hypothetical protein